MSPKSAQSTVAKSTTVASDATTRPKTVDQAVAPLTEGAVKAAGDASSENILTQARNVAVGIASLFLIPRDAQDRAVAELLKDVKIDLSSVTQIAKAGGELIASLGDRDALEAAAREATATVELKRAQLRELVAKFANLARGTLGAQSPVLAKLGIKALGGRKGVKRTKKVKDAGSKDSSPAPKA